jgi:hypothetical protein
LSNYVNKDNNFELTQASSGECPHCGEEAELIAIATPSFETLTKSRPRHVGLALRCSACNEPRFMRAKIRSYAADRIELSSNLVELERSREKFPYQYLPERIARSLRESLECYSADCHNAFALMCRRTVRESSDDLGKHMKLRWHDMFQDVIAVAGVDAATTRTIEIILFGPDEAVPEIGADESAVLIEVIKDLMYQCYVRAAKLQAAMRMRRFFAAEGDSVNVTPIAPQNRRTEPA